RVGFRLRAAGGQRRLDGHARAARAPADSRHHERAAHRRGYRRRRGQPPRRATSAALSTQPDGSDPGTGGLMSTLESRANPSSSTSLAELLERVLDKGIVIAGDVQVNLLDIELLTLKLRLLIASADT